MISKPNTRWGGGLLQRSARQRPQTLALQVGRDAPQHLRQVRAGAAARVQHVNIVAGQAVGNSQVVPERPVHAGHHVAHHLGRCVPHAQLLAQLRVEGLQEGLVEVGHRLALVEPGEELVALHPVQGGGGPVQHLHQAERL